MTRRRLDDEGRRRGCHATCRVWSLAALIPVAVACGGPPAAPPREGAPKGSSEPAPLPHPSDGQGSARLDGPTRVPAGSIQDFVVVYTASGDGIAEGGGVLLQVSPFFGWSEPQSRAPGTPGYVELSTTTKAKVELEVGDLHWVIARVVSGALLAGDTVALRYGPAVVDRFAESEERFYLKVDGNGDGFFVPLPAYPRIDILPLAPARLLLTASSFPRSDGSYDLRVAALDVLENRVPTFEGTVRLEAPASVTGLPATHTFTAADAGAHRFQFRVDATATGSAAGPLRIEARDEASGIGGRSNGVATTQLPLDGYELLWGDLHGHTNVSDGSGTPEDYYAYGRDVAGLDVVALTDHDAHGLWALDERPDLWERIKRATAETDVPGELVAFPAFEWTNWTYGHKHVLYANDAEASILSMREEATSTPEGLWKELEGKDAITISHHPGGGPVPVDWDHHDARFEPVVEVISIHGSSESYGGVRSIYRPMKGHFAQDALARGHRLGFVGSGDTHNGHPGQGDTSAPTGGLAGILARGRTRADVLEAIRARRTFATSGVRTTVLFWIEDVFMGDVARVKAGSSVRFRARVWAEEAIDRVELVRDGAVVSVASPPGLDAVVEGVDEGIPAGRGYYYLRVTQLDEEQAFSSPVFYEAGP